MSKKRVVTPIDVSLKAALDECERLRGMLAQSNERYVRMAEWCNELNNELRDARLQADGCVKALHKLTGNGMATRDAWAPVQDDLI